MALERLFSPVGSLSRFRPFRTLAATAAVLELRNERAPLALRHEVYMCCGGNPEREFCNSVEIGYCKIAPSDDVHADQDISAGEIAFGDAYAANANRVR